MKRIIFAALASLMFMLTSCEEHMKAFSDSGKDSTQAKNLAAFETVTKAFDSGDPSGIDSVVADNYVDHTDHGEVRGKDSLKAMIMMMHKSFKDMKTETLNTATSGDYVYGWMRYKGTSDGSMGMPAGPYNMAGIELVKFNDGKATAHWSFMDMQDMMKNDGATAGNERYGYHDEEIAKTIFFLKNRVIKSPGFFMPGNFR